VRYLLYIVCTRSRTITITGLIRLIFLALIALQRSARMKIGLARAVLLF